MLSQFNHFKQKENKVKIEEKINKYLSEAKKDPSDIKDDAVERLERLADRANVEFDDESYNELPKYKKQVDNFVKILKKAVDKTEALIRDALGRLH